MPGGIRNTRGKETDLINFRFNIKLLSAHSPWVLSFHGLKRLTVLMFQVGQIWRSNADSTAQAKVIAVTEDG